MKNSNGLNELFLDQLEGMYNSENQIIDSLPKLIKLASNNELKDALSKHLKETENQVVRLEKIFSILGIKISKKPCEAMKSLIHEAETLIGNKNKSSSLDAAIICAAQKVEHYEIASYGTLLSFAKHLDFDSEVCDLLKEILNEEWGADKKLTKIADGSIFSTGVNKEAAGATVTANSHKSKR